MFNFNWPKLWSNTTPPKNEESQEIFIPDNVFTSPMQSRPQEPLLPANINISPEQIRSNETTPPAMYKLLPESISNENAPKRTPTYSFGIGLSGAKDLAESSSRSQDFSPQLRSNEQTISPAMSKILPESITNESVPKRLPPSAFGIGVSGIKELTGKGHLDSSTQEQPKKKRRTDTIPEFTENKEKETTSPQAGSTHVITITKPSELLKFELNEIRSTCSNSNIDVNENDNKMQLIGKLLSLFPSSAFTAEDLEKFKPEQLRSICDSLLISRVGDKEALINRILKYAAKTPITKNDFTYYAPVLSMNLQNQVFHLQPQFLTPDQETYGWKHKGHQSIQMGGKQVQVDIEVTLKVREEEEKKKIKEESDSEEENTDKKRKRKRKKEEESDSDENDEDSHKKSEKTDRKKKKVKWYSKRKK
jgi:hypothetical protein